MALRPDRSYPLHTDISFYNADTSAERGGVVVISTAASGAAMDDGAAVVTYTASPSGKVPAGILLADMVNYDLTTREPNRHKLEVQAGGKVPVATVGWVVTNMIFPGTTPTAGGKAYLQMSGYITPTVHANGGEAATPRVGTFLSTKDQDGYAKVSFAFPN